MRRVNINPTAFVTLGGLGPGGGSPLPVQFKFRIALECPPIALMDPELVVALGGGNAMGAIAAKETRAIANLFAKRSTHNFRCYDILHVISSFKDLSFLSAITLSSFLLHTITGRLPFQRLNCHREAPLTNLLAHLAELLEVHLIRRPLNSTPMFQST